MRWCPIWMKTFLNNKLRAFRSYQPTMGKLLGYGTKGWGRSHPSKGDDASNSMEHTKLHIELLSKQLQLLSKQVEMLQQVVLANNNVSPTNTYIAAKAKETLGCKCTTTGIGQGKQSDG
jgi:hypothetical protein